MNYVVLTGSIANDLIEQENEKIITLAVKRSFKNTDGIYETDHIPCKLSSGITANASDYCQKGDVIGIKGRIQSDDTGIYIIAEKITFLSSKKSEEN